MSATSSQHLVDTTDGKALARECKQGKGLAEPFVLLVKDKNDGVGCGRLSLVRPFQILEDRSVELKKEKRTNATVHQWDLISQFFIYIFLK